MNKLSVIPVVNYDIARSYNYNSDSENFNRTLDISDFLVEDCHSVHQTHHASFACLQDILSNNATEIV